MSTNITYLKGDATYPIGDDKKIICHICNDKGCWGLGFVLAVSARWLEPEEIYRATKKYILGTVIFARVEEDILVANMIAQHDIKYDENGCPPIRYNAVRTCLARVNALAKTMNATIHMTRIGCGLAGGHWFDIEKIIQETCTVDVYVYDLPPIVR